MQLHTILGANGTIATELVPVLLENKEQVRLVSRNPKPVAGTETMAADMLDYQQVLKAVEGSHVVYLLVGLEYNIKVWKRDWPTLMRNVINACRVTGAKLIFFDSVYPYGKTDGKMTEETAFNPGSKKGEVRAIIDRMLLDEMKAGFIKVIIARAADFYGPRCLDKSAVGLLVFDKLNNNSAAQCMVSSNLPHSYTYTPDAAKGMYMLAKREDTFNQTWHLPTASPALTGKEFIDIAAKHLGVKSRIQILPKWLMKLMGIFSVMMREIAEMLYQNEYAYQFDSTKFEKAFNFKPTSYEAGIKETAEWFKKNKKK